jgi:lipoprotein NlpD
LPKRAQEIYHVVRSGETLFRIGKAYDVPYQELARINRIHDPRQLRVGQRIFIPEATSRLPVDIITPEEPKVESPSGAGRRVKGRYDFIWPLNGRLTSKFGPRGSNFHDGIDIRAAEGNLIRAAKGGEVIYSDHLRGYGKLIIIRHSGGLASVYAHNRDNRVQTGQRVAQGDVIGGVGRTGRVTSPHLHFEIRKDNVAKDPLRYLPPL